MPPASHFHRVTARDHDCINPIEEQSVLHDVGDCGETGEDRVAMQLSASGLDIATEHPCPAEVLQDLHAAVTRGPQSRGHKRPSVADRSTQQHEGRR